MSEAEGVKRLARGRFVAWLTAVVGLTVLVRLPCFRIPLDQDSAVYAYCARAWSEGELPYRDVWDHKPPLIYLVYRGLFLLGPSAGTGVNATLRVGSVACDAATVVLLVLLARRFFGAGVALSAGAIYGLFTGAPVLQLEAFQPERLTALLCVAGMLAAAWYADTRRYEGAALSGVLFSLGIVAKQIAAPIGLLAWAWVTWEALRAEGRAAIRRVVIHSLLMALGAVVPWAAFAGYFAANAAFGSFWECTVTYNLRYAGEQRQGGLVAGVGKAFTRLFFDHLPLWLSAAGGVVAALMRRAERRGGLVVGAWIVMAFVALILPGQFAYYYYVPTVAPLAVASAVAFAGLARVLVPRKADGVTRDARRETRSLEVVAAAAASLVLLATLLLAAKRSLAVYRDHVNPRQSNAVAARVAEEIAAGTQPSERIYMRGGRPQVYVLSGRRNASPYLYDFFYGIRPESAYLYQPHMLRVILEGLERWRPRFIVVTTRGDGGKGEVFDGAWENLPKYFPDFLKHLAAHYGEPKRYAAVPVSFLLFRRREAP